MEYKEKIKEQEELQQIVKGHRQEGKVVVQCHGCFDILHPGHVRYLEMAKKQGDILVVSLTAEDAGVAGHRRACHGRHDHVVLGVIALAGLVQ